MTWSHADLRRGGSSIHTGNEYLRAIKQFCRWLVKDRRAGDNPLAHLQAAYAKNRWEVNQPLPPDLPRALADYLADRPPDRPVWPETWREKAADMFRHDLQTARETWLSEAQDARQRAEREQTAFPDLPRWGRSPC